MAIEFQREAIATLWGELHPLLDAHYAEIAADKTIPLCPDVEKYELLDQAGMLRGYTARVDGQLIGYACFFVQPHIHYATSVQALQDVIFIAQEHRRGRQRVDTFVREFKLTVRQIVDRFGAYDQRTAGHPWSGVAWKSSGTAPGCRIGTDSTAG